VAAAGTVARPHAVGGWPAFSHSLGLVGAFPGEEPTVRLHPEAEELLGDGRREQEGEGSPCPLVPIPGRGRDGANGSPRPQFKRRVQESTQVLRELEISLRTNYIG